MLRSEAVLIIQEIMQIVGSDTAPIIARLKQAQDLAEKDPGLPWFLDAVDDTLVTTAGIPTVTPPTDFIREMDEAPLYYIPASTNKPTVLVKESDEYLRTKWYTPGEPQGYKWLGSQIEIYPTPDAEYSLVLPYYAADEVLNSDIENKWLAYAAYWLIGIAGTLLAPSWRDSGGASFFDSVGQGVKNLVMQETMNRRYRNREFFMGGED